MKWQDHIPDTEVLQMSDSRSIDSVLITASVVWTYRSYAIYYRLSKCMFLEKFGDRSRAMPRKRYKNTFNVALKMCKIKPESREYIAQDRATQRNLVKQGVSKYAQEFIDQNVDKRRRRKERLAGPPTDDQSFYWPHCSRSFRARISVVIYLKT